VLVLRLEAVGRAFEAVHCLLQAPRNHTKIVVAVAEDVVASRKTVRRAFLLHLVELFDLELVIADGAPVVRRRVHREAGRERAVGADNQ